MPKHRTPLDRQAALFAARAARQLAQLQGAMRSAEDTASGLRRALKVPVPSGGSRYIKGSRTAPSIFESAGISGAGNFASGGLFAAAGIDNSSAASFYSSASQMGSLWSDALQLGQRVM